MNTENMVIVYVRRSTDNGQKHSIEAQLTFIKQFCHNNELQVFAVYSETGTGTTIVRPVLTEALRVSHKLNIPIVVRSMSRLGRDAAEVIQLLNSGRFIIADQGMKSDTLMLNLLAVLNQNERNRISIRTKEALQAAKKKGIQLGNPRLHEARLKGLRKNMQNADAFALSVLELFQQNATFSYRKQAELLNKWHVPSRRGGKWYAQSVKNVHQRIKRLKLQ